MKVFKAALLLTNAFITANGAFVNTLPSCSITSRVTNKLAASKNLSTSSAWSSTSSTCTLNHENDGTAEVSRSKFFQKAIQTTKLVSLSSALLSSLDSTVANAATATTDEAKQFNLTPEEIAQIVKTDITQNSFLTNGQLTRSIYDEKATFTDEIDTYTLPQWIKGTAKLFVPPSKGGSRVGLVGDVFADQSKVEFRFEEDLMFNIPFKPIVFVSGKVVLDRDLDSGLITSYREFWDQDVNTVLKSARFK